MATLTQSRPVAVANVPLVRQLAWWSVAFPVIMVVAIARHDVRLLNWIHVLAGFLWTGADVFTGFILAPVMRRLDMPHRVAVIAFLVPRTLLYFPMVSLTASTAGWYLASWFGWVVPGNQNYPWIVAALVLVSLMTIQGLGVLLPNSVRIWLELRKPEPRRDLIVRLNRINLLLSGTQGLMQVAIIVVMSRLVLG
jgi:hypothetical protein